ncbi:MAG: hypothetical protein C5B47_04690 [Verrucomicrobia bacterium]|nr:MAG: hypothetical protein C5B47_04690 [Verrucomicrobiota bacterium]
MTESDISRLEAYKPKIWRWGDRIGTLAQRVEGLEKEREDIAKKMSSLYDKLWSRNPSTKLTQRELGDFIDEVDAFEKKLSSITLATQPQQAERKVNRPVAVVHPFIPGQ